MSNLGNANNICSFLFIITYYKNLFIIPFFSNLMTSEDRNNEKLFEEKVITALNDKYRFYSLFTGFIKKLIYTILYSIIYIINKLIKIIYENFNETYLLNYKQYNLH